MYDTHFMGGWWDTVPVYMIWRGNKFHAPAEIRNLDRLAHNLVNCKENLKSGSSCFSNSFIVLCHLFHHSFLILYDLSGIDCCTLMAYYVHFPPFIKL